MDELDLDQDVLDQIEKMDTNKGLDINKTQIINAKKDANGLYINKLKTQITKLLTTNILEDTNKNQEENNDFLNELKDILSNYE